jgi:hypothetical protein
MSRVSIIAILSLSIWLLFTILRSNLINTTDMPHKTRTGGSALLKQNETDGVNSHLDTFGEASAPTVGKYASDTTITTPDPVNGLQAADRIWGEVIATSKNKRFQLKIYANAVCQILPNITSEQYFSKNGADPVGPQYGTNWPSGVGIKIRDKNGEILGVKNGFSTGWMNPNWGGSGNLITDEIFPMYSDGLDLSQLMKHLIPRIPGELADSADMSQYEFKLKVFTSKASILQSDGTAVPPEDCNDFESDWISGTHLESKP